MLRNIFDNAKKEPLAAIAIVLTVGLAVLQSEWLARLFSSSIELRSYYQKQSDGRCSLVALAVDNKTEAAASDIRIYLIEDWITKRGDEELQILNRKDGMISPKEKTPMPFRESLDVEFTVEGNALAIPLMLSGEYIDLFLARTINPALDEARKALATDSRYRVSPRIATASYQKGPLKQLNLGDCAGDLKDQRR